MKEGGAVVHNPFLAQPIQNQLENFVSLPISFAGSQMQERVQLCGVRREIRPVRLVIVSFSLSLLHLFVPHLVR
jgi:hypothetical protein